MRRKELNRRRANSPPGDHNLVLKLIRFEWLASLPRSVALASAVSTWTYRPPSPREMQEVMALLREQLAREPGRRRAAPAAREAICCGAVIAACCP